MNDIANKHINNLRDVINNNKILDMSDEQLKNIIIFRSFENF